jgi:hypothetical protein
MAEKEKYRGSISFALAHHVILQMVHKEEQDKLSFCILHEMSICYLHHVDT